MCDWPRVLAQQCPDGVSIRETWSVFIASPVSTRGSKLGTLNPQNGHGKLFHCMSQEKCFQCRDSYVWMVSIPTIYLFYSYTFQGLDMLIHTNTRKVVHQCTDTHARYVLSHRSIYLQFTFASHMRENAGIDEDILEEHQELIQRLIRAYTVHSVDTPAD